MATHLEYISDQKFNSSFKNMLRDYYTYGFKDKLDYDCSGATYDSDRKRLNVFLKDYMEWSDLKKRKSATSVGKNVTFISCDSQSMEINPFHRVYRFCGTNRPEYLYCFFHIIAILNSSFQLSEGVESLEIDSSTDEKLEGVCTIHGNSISSKQHAAIVKLESKLNVQENKVIRVIESMHVGSEIEELLEQFYSDEDMLIEKAKEFCFSDEQIYKLKSAIRDSVIRLKTSDLVQIYGLKTRDAIGSDIESVSRTMNNRLQRLSDIGVICCDQNGGDYVFSEEQIQQIMGAIPDEIKELLEKENKQDVFERSLRNHTLIKPGDKKWYLSGLTLKRVVESGQSVNNQFVSHLKYALDFYSKTFMFGEIGTFLLDRMKVNINSPIRIKHEYYMHSLNDFNAIDLMNAIEEKKWCLISYKRENVKTKLLCYPIELRISSIDGREYLMFYEPFKKSCVALRLEFIESINYYHDHEVKKDFMQYYPDKGIDIDRNVSRAKLLMDYIWGVSTGINVEKNTENLRNVFKELRVRIAYDKDVDYYILNRLYRESRIGMICVNEEEGYIDFSVVAANINEVIPFIRSFYARVISCTGFDEQGFSLEADVKHLVNKEGKINEQKNYSEYIGNVDNGFLEVLGDGMKANAHEKLFNEIFSAYFHIFAAIFSEICNGEEEYDEKGIDKICKKVMYEYKEECGLDMLRLFFKEGKVFADHLIKGGFLLKKENNGTVVYISKYETNSLVDLYRDIIPLSEVEIRWLKTIIIDEKIHYFLNQKEIMALKLVLAEMAMEIKPFSMEVVNYYDRYKFSPKKEWKEGTVLVPILDAINMNHIVKIKYVSSKKNINIGNYKPIWIEYSKRDNCFKGYFQSCKRKEGIKVYNLAQFISVEDTKKEFDRREVRKSFDSYRERQMDEVELEFENKPYIADRVLTEFSPWKKRCEFDSEVGVYRLIVYYQKQDGKEMAIRIMALGENVRLVDSHHKLAIIIQSKLRDQRKCIIKENVRFTREEEIRNRTR